MTGLSKIASLTTTSLSKAYSSYKKNQEIKKIKEIKLKKLEDNSQIQKEKKELRIWEDKLQKENNKLRLKEDELKIKEKELKDWNKEFSRQAKEYNPKMKKKDEPVYGPSPAKKLENLPDGVLGKAHKDGTIQIRKGLSKEKRKKVKRKWNTERSRCDH